VGPVRRTPEDATEVPIVFTDASNSSDRRVYTGLAHFHRLTIGRAACSSSVLTRPSQNCVLLYRAFSMVGALRWPARPLMPIDTRLPSVNARAGSWQVLQATVPSADKRPSKNSFSPSSIFSGVCGLSIGIAARVASSGRPTCSIGL
jgi:hypothetical protein